MATLFIAGLVLTVLGIIGVLLIAGSIPSLISRHRKLGRLKTKRDSKRGQLNAVQYNISKCDPSTGKYLRLVALQDILFAEIQRLNRQIDELETLELERKALEDD